MSLIRGSVIGLFKGFAWLCQSDEVSILTPASLYVILCSYENEISLEIQVQLTCECSSQILREKLQKDREKRFPVFDEIGSQRRRLENQDQDG
jgi:hypothetical protein